MPYKDKERQREFNRLWIAQRRADFFRDKFCVKCQSTDSMELDHIDPAQKVSHSIWSWSEPKRLAEIAKCQVLCSKCHKAKTAEFVSRPITHGNSGYDRKCRCVICKAAHSERMKLRVR